MRLTLVLFTLCASVAPALADAVPGQAPIANIAEPDQVPVLEVDSPKSPMLLEIEGLMLAQDEKVRALTRRFAATQNPDEAQRLQRQVAEVKQATERSILLVQLRYAEAAGQIALAEELRAHLDFLEHPTVPLAKVERPAPSKERRR